MVTRVGYIRQEWPTIAERAGLYVSQWPRGQFEHVLIVRKQGATLLLFDQRQSPLALAGEVERVDESRLVIAKGAQGQSCNEVCTGVGRQCDARWFDRVNNCRDLAAAFPCERGCSYEVWHAPRPPVGFMGAFISLLSTQLPSPDL